MGLRFFVAILLSIPALVEAQQRQPDLNRMARDAAFRGARRAKEAVANAKDSLADRLSKKLYYFFGNSCGENQFFKGLRDPGTTLERKDLRDLMLMGDACESLTQTVAQNRFLSQEMVLQLGETYVADRISANQIKELTCEMNYLSTFDLRPDRLFTRLSNEQLDSVRGLRNTSFNIDGVRVQDNIRYQSPDPEGPIHTAALRISDLAKVQREIISLDTQIKDLKSRLERESASLRTSKAGPPPGTHTRIASFQIQIAEKTKIREEEQKVFNYFYSSVWNIENPAMQKLVERYLRDPNFKLEQFDSPAARNRFQNEVIAELKGDVLTRMRERASAVANRSRTEKYARSEMLNIWSSGAYEDLFNSQSEAAPDDPNDPSADVAIAMDKMRCHMSAKYGLGVEYVNWAQKVALGAGVAATAVAVTVATGGTAAAVAGSGALRLVSAYGASRLVHLPTMAYYYNEYKNCSGKKADFTLAKESFCSSMNNAQSRHLARSGARPTAEETSGAQPIQREQENHSCAFNAVLSTSIGVGLGGLSTRGFRSLRSLKKQ